MPTKRAYGAFSLPHNFDVYIIIQAVIGSALALNAGIIAGGVALLC